MGKPHVADKTPRELTDAEIRELADYLRGKRVNVYAAVSSLFSCATFDTVFPRLESVAGLFKCVECNFWLDTTERDEGIPDSCAECQAEVAEDDLE